MDHNFWLAIVVLFLIFALLFTYVSIRGAKIEFYEEGTLEKTYEAIQKTGLSRETATDIINELYNAGIYLREYR